MLVVVIAEVRFSSSLYVLKRGLHLNWITVDELRVFLFRSIGSIKISKIWRRLLSIGHRHRRNAARGSCAPRPVSLSLWMSVSLRLFASLLSRSSFVLFHLRNRRPRRMLELFAANTVSLPKAHTLIIFSPRHLISSGPFPNSAFVPLAFIMMATTVGPLGSITRFRLIRVNCKCWSLPFFHAKNERPLAG